MKSYKTMQIENGDFLVPYRIYDCNGCHKPVEEAWPRYEDDEDVFCLDCALKLGKISGKEYAQSWPGIGMDDAIYHNGEIHMKKGNCKWPWELTQREQRKTAEYRKWRKEVLKRDNNTCKRCGSNNKLEAHHIRPFVTNPDLAFETFNGITLCKDCHKYVHKTKDKRWLWQDEC